MEKDSVSRDGNLIGRLGAVVVILAVVVGLGRVCGSGAGACPFMSGRMCPFSSREAAAPAETPTAAPASVPAAKPSPQK